MNALRAGCLITAWVLGACTLDPDAVAQPSETGSEGASGVGTVSGGASGTGTTGPGGTGGSTTDGGSGWWGATGGTQASDGTESDGYDCAEDPRCNEACPDDPCLVMCPVPPPGMPLDSTSCEYECGVCISTCVEGGACTYECINRACGLLCRPSDVCELPRDCDEDGCFVYDYCSFFPGGC